jgi:carboxymethylenebutenolidase
MTISLPRFRTFAISVFLLTGFCIGQAQDWAKARLEASPRHREYVNLKNGSRTIQALVVYPEVKDKAPVVLLIHEIFGLSDWAKEMADELAAQGYIVVAPDLVSGLGPKGGGTSDFPSQDAVIKAVSGLDADAVNSDLDKAADYGKHLPSANRMIASVGFCWGGGKSFAFAAHRKDLSAAFVFYGPGPADVTTIHAPVYGFYAGNDARIGATIPATTAAMKAAGKVYESITYPDAGHGFMRAGEDPTNTVAGNKTAREQAFARLVALLKTMNPPQTANADNDSHASTEKGKKALAQCHETTDPLSVAGTM